MKNKKSIRYRILELRIKHAEKKFLENNQNMKYRFFGYLGMDGLPVFIEEGRTETSGSGQTFNCANFVYVFTPKMLSHCVMNLTNDEKISQKNNISSFREMCIEIAEASEYQSESWEDKINELATYLQNQDISEME